MNEDTIKSRKTIKFEKKIKDGQYTNKTKNSKVYVS